MNILFKLVRNITSSNSIIFWPINFIIYRFIRNNLYLINKVINKTSLIGSNRIMVELVNGDKLVFTSESESIPVHLLNKFKFSKANKINNIKEYKKFFFIYDLIDEVYVQGSHFNQLDYSHFNTIIDAGANIGAFTINAKRTAKNSTKYILIEPDEKNYNDLIENMKLNNITNFLPVKKGLWSSDGILNFYLSDRAGEHSVINSSSQVKKIEIDVFKLETLFDDNEIILPAIIKMDIEGAELEVISSSIKLLKNTKGITLLIEALHFVNGEETYKKIIPLLKENNFKIINWKSDFRGTIYAINNL